MASPKIPSFNSFPFKSRLFDVRSALSGSPRAEILSGLTVAVALVPEAVAFALLAGVPPLVGLYAAFMVCLITSVLGGRPGMISGATGAMAVVVVSLIAEHGIGYLFPAVVLCGAIQITVVSRWIWPSMGVVSSRCCCPMAPCPTPETVVSI